MSNFETVKNIYNYAEYCAMIQRLSTEGKTTGPVQSESLIGFTKLNLQRMARWDKTFVVNEMLALQLQNLKNKQIWWVITEGWCGDSAQIIPILAKMEAVANGKIELRMILRDENPEIMDSYLTNGGRSIPKLIAENERGEDIFTWGPRPEPAQEIILDWKANQNTKSHDEAEKDLHLWYARNKGETIQQEIAALVTA